MSYKHLQWVFVLRAMLNKEYWNRPNTVEFFAFITRVGIVVPGLLFNMQIWWLYIFALISSVALIWSSTKKTLPTLVWFNFIWVFLSIASIVKYFSQN